MNILMCNIWIVMFWVLRLHCMCMYVYMCIRKKYLGSKSLPLLVFVSTRGRSTCTEERSTPQEMSPASCGFFISRTRPGSSSVHEPRTSMPWWDIQLILYLPSMREPVLSCWFCLDTVLYTVTSARCRSTTLVGCLCRSVCDCLTYQFNATGN